MGLSLTKADGRTLLDFKELDIHGVKSMSGFCFNFRFTGKRGAIEEDELIHISQQVLELGLNDGNTHISFALPSYDTKIEVGRYGDTDLFFKCVLSGNTIEKLEALRNGKNHIELNIRLAGVIDEAGSWSKFSQSENFSVSSQQWMNALNSSGYQKSLFYEVIFSDDLGDTFGAISDLIQKAQGHIHNGLYDDAVANCRKILERIDSLADSKNEDSRVFNLFAGSKESRENMTIQERLLFMRRVVKYTTHIGAHDGDERYSRNQARSILAMVISLLPIAGLDIPDLVTTSHEK